ncbi:helix-turn-helix domain-containing protein [Longispora urticae]
METLGERLRYWRRRRGGLSQQVLADRAGLSQPYLSQIERGDRPLDRRSTQIALAGALGITVAELLGEPGDPTDPSKAAAAMHVPAIRAALVEISAGERREPSRPLNVLAAEATLANQLREQCKYAALAPILPQLLLDLAGHGGTAMVETLFVSRFLLKYTGYADLALLAGQAGWTYARELEDPAWRGLGLFNLYQSYPHESAELVGRLAAAAANDLQRHTADPNVRQAYGLLLLMAAYSSAVALKHGDAMSYLTEAGREAAALGEPTDSGFARLWFGPTNVNFWGMSLAAEFEDPDMASQLAEQTRADIVTAPNRQCWYYMDLGRSLIKASGREADAVAALDRAERSAPQHFRVHPSAREGVAVLVQRARRRAVAGPLTRMANGLGLDLPG